MTGAPSSATLDPLFSPRSLAVLGVSRNPAKLGFRLLQNVKAHGFGGAIYPVNASGEAILDCPSVRAVDELPDAIDLALVSLPASAVPQAIAGLARRRVRAAVILSSGFAEVDDGGRAVQAGMFETARRAGLRLVGPNCMGVFSAPARLNGTYFWDLPRVSGGIGVVSQSGAYGGLMFRQLGARGLGVARFLSIGNQADVDIAEVIDYLGHDRETTLIACFVEALRDGRRFVEVASRVTPDKPIVVLKGGRSDAGRRAAGSHTGSLAGTYDVYRAAFERAGVVVVDETEELFDAIEALVIAGAARPSAPSVAVVTVSGGPSVVAADAAERAGLTVPPLGDTARTRLRAVLPSFAASGNPVDLTPQVDPDKIGDAVKTVFDEPVIAGAIAVNVGLDIPQFADALIAEARAQRKPVVAFTADTPGVTARFITAGVPVLPSPERAVRAWRALWSARRRPPMRLARRLPLPADVVEALRSSPDGPLPYGIARRALEAYGVRFCRETVVDSVDEALRAADTLGYPVVVKADAAGLTHKTEIGGVRLDVRDAPDLRRACAEMRADARAERFIVQERIGAGVELLIGGRRDEVFGPLVAVGIGGILTEALRDVAFAVAPLADHEARVMLREGARGRLLAGPRGLPACDEGPLIEAALGVGDLMLAEPRIVEIDLNPVIAAGATAVAVDAVVIVD